MDKEQDVRMLFGGDFAPYGQQYEELIAANGGEIFGSARKYINVADFTIINMEAPVPNAADAIMKIGPVIRATPLSLKALTEAGVDAVSLANNHILDYGEDGLLQTMAALKVHGIKHVGAGLDRLTAEAPLRIEIRGRRISLFAFAEREFNLSKDGKIGAAILDPIRIAPLLIKERAQADAIIVFFHGGNEYFSYPRPGLRKLCQFLIGIGADAVIGHHPHIPGPYEIYRGKPIAYSLGNLVFDTRVPPPEWDKGYLAGLDLVFGDAGLENIRIELIPYQQSITQGGIKIMEGLQRVSFLSHIEQMRDHLENHPNVWLASWKRFVEKKKVQALIDMMSPIRFRGFRRLMAFRFVRSIIAPPSRQLHRLNLLRCPSHQELLVDALESHLTTEHEFSSAKDN